NPSRQIEETGDNRGRDLAQDDRIDIPAPRHGRRAAAAQQGRYEDQSRPADADAVRSLAKLAGSHPVDPPVDDDLGMLAIANIAAEDPGATFPQYRHAGAPDGHHFLIRRYPAASFALAGFAGLATGESRATGHADL